MMVDVLTAPDAREAGSLAVAPLAWHRTREDKWESETLTSDGDRCTTCGKTIPDTDPWLESGSCDCTRSAHMQATAAWYEHRGLGHPMWSKSGTPARFRNVRLAEFVIRKGTETALARCTAWAESYDRQATSKGLYLSGPWGSGKTHLAAATAFRACQRTGAPTQFVTAGGLIAAVKGGTDFDMAPHRKALECDLLVLDDIGQIGRTEFDRELIFTLIAGRYEQMSPTIFTSNLPVDRLMDSLGGAAVSRLYESTDQLVVAASDYRRQRATA